MKHLNKKVITFKCIYEFVFKFYTINEYETSENGDKNYQSMKTFNYFI